MTTHTTAHTGTDTPSITDMLVQLTLRKAALEHRKDELSHLRPASTAVTQAILKINREIITLTHTRDTMLDLAESLDLRTVTLATDAERIALRIQRLRAEGELDGADTPAEIAYATDQLRVANQLTY